MTALTPDPPQDDMPAVQVETCNSNEYLSRQRDKQQCEENLPREREECLPWKREEYQPLERKECLPWEHEEYQSQEREDIYPGSVRNAYPGSVRVPTLGA